MVLGHIIGKSGTNEFYFLVEDTAKKFMYVKAKNKEAKLLKLNTKGMTGSELMHMLPAKLSGSQMGLLYGALSNINRVNDFDQLMLSLQSEENNAKWTLINVID